MLALFEMFPLLLNFIIHFQLWIGFGIFNPMRDKSSSHLIQQHTGYTL